MEYKTVENFYQAMKLPKNRTDLREEIAAMNPYEAKKIIRDKTKYKWREDWTQEESLKVMNFILKVKFLPHTSWAKKLIETGQEEIVEWNNWGDVFWGKDIKTKKGENHLGKLLMEIRKEISEIYYNGR